MKDTKGRKRALITGITGQDGSYLAEFLMKKGYEVHGLVRRTSTFNRHNIEALFAKYEAKRAFLHYGDMTDWHSLVSVIQKVKPHEIYNLAAQSHVRVSFEIPFYTAQSDAVGVLGVLEAARIVAPKARIYQASTSELYSGDKEQSPQNESTPFQPRSPYGVAKLYGFHCARIYRESYGMHISNGILFNHESPRRGENFVSRKIAIGAVEITKGVRDILYLGNLDAARDWGYAPEYMEAAWRMLQQKKPGDYVIATGETHTVRDFASLAFARVGMALVWKGSGVKERGIDSNTGRTVVAVDPMYFRPNEVSYLCGNASLARKKLGWKPKVLLPKLVDIMMNAEIARYEQTHGNV